MFSAKFSGKFIGKFAPSSSFSTGTSDGSFLRSNSSRKNSFSVEASPVAPDYAEIQIKQLLLDLSKSFDKQSKAVKKFREYMLK